MALESTNDAWHLGKLLRTVDLRMRGEDLLNHRRSGARQPEDENRIRVRSPNTRARREEVFCAHFDLLACDGFGNLRTVFAFGALQCVSALVESPGFCVLVQVLVCFTNSQVFDHTSVIQFIEKRFGVTENNISPWRRAVAGDLTSMFNFANPNSQNFNLPTTATFLPPVDELAGGNVNTFIPSLGSVILGVPPQEKGVRPTHALPYELHVHATVNASTSTVVLKFSNKGAAAAVFQVRSGDPADLVRTYTVEPGKYLEDTWTVVSSYDLSVYGPNGFVRFFKGSIGSSAAALDVSVRHKKDDGGSITWSIKNVGGSEAEVSVLDAYTGNGVIRLLRPEARFEEGLSLQQFFGWYDLIVTVAGDATFNYRLAGHVETGRDSFSDPALGGLVTLEG